MALRLSNGSDTMTQIAGATAGFGDGPPPPQPHAPPAAPTQLPAARSPRANSHAKGTTPRRV